MAQVYSQNIVGYVNVTCSNLFTLIENPLDDGAGNTVSNVLKSAPAGTAIFTFNGTNFALNTLDLFGGWWTRPADVVAPGAGFFVQNNNGAPFTLTFVGNVLTGTLNTPLKAGVYSLVGSQVPQSGFMGDLGYAGVNGDFAFRYANTFILYTKDLFGGGWSSSKAGDTQVDNTKGPFFNIAESMFYNNQAGVATNWTRTFVPQ